MSLPFLSIAAALLVIVTFIFLSMSSRSSGPTLGYVVNNTVTHARLIPTPSKHAFTYPVLSFLLSLNSLETHQLDLGKGWVFSYGGLWGRLTGIRSLPYLTTGPESIRWKLEQILRAKGMQEQLEDAWMLTMPSYLGVEGINPLTVYFCYRNDAEQRLWTVVLEIHNTFGESHIHVLEVGKAEDAIIKNGFTNSWTFPREFHVSPFNDRTGYYRVSIRAPLASPSMLRQGAKLQAPYPAISVHFHEADSDAQVGALKLTALLTATTIHPLTTLNLLRELSKQPFVLLLSFGRILYHAWILHYVKRLDVYLRPEPKTSGKEPGLLGLGVRHLGASPLESFAQRRVETYLQQRVNEIGVRVILKPSDPAAPLQVFGSEHESSTLTIHILTPKFYTMLFSTPSAEWAALVGQVEGMFRLGSDTEQALFLKVFASTTTHIKASMAQRLRVYSIPPDIRARLPFRVPASHFLDRPSSLGWLAGVLVLVALQSLDSLETFIFGVARARIVPAKGDLAGTGQGTAKAEMGPVWGLWQRALAAYNIAT